MNALVGSCHCGRVRITLPRKPAAVTRCNCSLCTKTGFEGVYFPSGELHIEGELDSYVRSRKALVGGHAMLDHMAEVDDPFFFKIRHEANTPISSQTMLRAVDGKARCHHPLMANPAAPTMFMT